VSLEQTLYPGTTIELVVPILGTSGFKVGKDSYVGFSPARVDPGNANFSTQNTSKIMSGFDEESADRVEVFYSRVVASPGVADRL
jgi:UDP-N-acetyl-D-glucosamine dehydrogenase